jgi:hypothetical protein
VINTTLLRACGVSNWVPRALLQVEICRKRRTLEGSGTVDRGSDELL